MSISQEVLQKFHGIDETRQQQLHNLINHIFEAMDQHSNKRITKAEFFIYGSEQLRSDDPKQIPTAPDDPLPAGTRQAGTGTTFKWWGQAEAAPAEAAPAASTTNGAIESDDSRDSPLFKEDITSQVAFQVLLLYCSFNAKQYFDSYTAYWKLVALHIDSFSRTFVPIIWVFGLVVIRAQLGSELFWDF